jgi:hypothetical protein
MQRTIMTAAILAACGSTALAQSTALTYQGLLKDGGINANGTYDLRFRLYDAVVGGSQPGPTVCVDNVAVADGRFTVTIDLGQQYATTAARFLEIESRRDTGLSCANLSGFTILSPRQPVTATPMASHAKSAFALDAPDGSPLGAVIVDNAGNVGMGIGVPGARLHLLGNVGGASPGEGLRIQGLGVSVDNLAYASFHNGAGTPIGYVGDGSNGDNNVFLATYLGDVSLITPGGRVLNATAAGNVGIGTTTPAAKLDVAGNVHTTGVFIGDARVQRYKTIHGSTFQPETDSGDDNPFTIRYADGIIGSTPSNGICTENYYYAPVELPDGALITNVLFTYYDNGPCGTYGELYRVHLFNGQLNNMVTFPFDDFNGTTVKIVGSSNISFATVDNSTYAYVLRVHMNGFNRASGSYMRILGARIRYETNIPYP